MINPVNTPFDLEFGTLRRRWLGRGFRSGRLTRRALGVAPLGHSFDTLLFQLLGRGMNRGEQVCVRRQPYQLMIVVVDGDLGMMQMPLERQNHVGFTLAPAIQQLAYLDKAGLELLELGWSQFHLPARVRDFHGTSLHPHLIYTAVVEPAILPAAALQPARASSNSEDAA